MLLTSQSLVFPLGRVTRLRRCNAVPRLLGIAEQPSDPSVDEIVRAVKVEGFGVLWLWRLADVRAHRIDVDAVPWPRARRMQEEGLLKHAAAAQRALQHVSDKRLAFSRRLNVE